MANVQDQATLAAREFFTPMLERAKLPVNPIFSKILASNTLGPGKTSFKIWPRDRDNDIYIELITFNGEYIYPDRKLFLLERSLIMHLEATKNDRATWIEVDTMYLKEVSFEVSQEPLSFSAQAYANSSKPVIPPKVETPPPVIETPPKQVFENDAPLSQMTMRDFLAIVQGVPCSTKPWLNSIILSSCPQPQTKSKGSK